MTASPQQAAQWINSAHAANASGDFEAAANWCRRALKVASDIPEAWYNLGIVRLRQASQSVAEAARVATPAEADAATRAGVLNAGFDALLAPTR